MLKIGVFGVGHLGKFHLNNWKEIDGVKLIGFFDPNNDNANAVTEKYGLKRFLDEDKLIDACDAIDVITPTNHHFDICMKAIRKGKHVFVEKPITNTIKEGRDLVDMVREANVKLQVGHVERFNPAFYKAQNNVYIMDHQIQNNTYFCTTGIEFNNGCVANLTSSRISMKKMRKMRLFQKDAYIGIDFLEKKTEIIKLKQPNDTGVFSFDIDTQNGKKTIAIATPSIEPLNAIKLELQAFVDAINHNTPTIVSEIDGFLAMEVAHQILEKINSTSILV